MADGPEALDSPVHLRKPTLGNGEIFREETRLEGGGSSGHDPQSPHEAQARFRDRALSIASEIRDRTPAQLGSSGRVVVEMQVLPNYLAASNTPTDLIGETGLAIVGTRPARGEYRTAKTSDPDREAKVYLLAGRPQEATALTTLIAGEPVPSKGFEDLKQLDGLTLGGPETVMAFRDVDVELDDDGRAILEAVLHPQLGEDGVGDIDTQRANVEAFGTYVKSVDEGATVSRAAIEDGLAFLSVTVDPSAIPSVALYTQLRVLRPLSTIRDPDEPREPEAAAAPPPWSLEGIATSVDTPDERIAVFDGGLPDELRALLGDLVTYTDLTGGQAVLPTYERHGGYVTSAALFGHLDPSDAAPRAGVHVDVFRVWPPPQDVARDEELHWVLDRVEEVLERGEYRVCVISLAPKINVDERLEPHRWTASLDRIARERNVLVCVAAGNTGHLAASADRLLIPADGINVLSVGASTTPDGPCVRADYSSVGPGRPGQTTAPTGVQFGGDLAVGRPFGALGPDGKVHGTEGTSVAAPPVARACALLRSALGPDADATLLRCLSAHGADRVRGGAKTQVGSTDREVGLGRLPLDLVAQLEHEPDSVTVVFRDVVLRGQQIALQFPFPDDLFDENANRKFRLRWTLSFMSDIDAASPVDYAGSAFEVYYRPHAQTFYMRMPDDPSDSIKVNRRAEPDLFEFALRQGRLVSERPASSGKPGWVPEVESRSRGKWETLVRVDTQPAGKALHRPGIDLHFLTRDAGRLGREPVPMAFALAVTLDGPKGSDVYRRVQQFAPALTPLVAAVPAGIHARLST